MDQCFKIIGVPEWYTAIKAAKQGGQSVKTGRFAGSISVQDRAIDDSPLEDVPSESQMSFANCAGNIPYSNSCNSHYKKSRFLRRKNSVANSCNPSQKTVCDGRPVANGRRYKFVANGHFCDGYSVAKYLATVLATDCWCG